MKKFLGIFLCFLLYLAVPTQIFAQTDEDLQIPTQEEQQQNTEEQTNTETEQKQETVQPQKTEYSFLTILGAILIPSLFIIIGYIVLKFFQN
jgi:putative cell wall-binding protein